MTVKFPFQKVLIANRGEIAVRVIRACRELNLATVAIYTEVDAGSAHVMLADEAVCIGEADARETYLVAEKILKAAKLTGADAVHPGFGFLSENADFARACKKAGLTFIGPTPEAIELMGDKVSARDAMKKAGVPIVPGSDGALASVEDALACAKKIGYPVILKATAGGGGKGMRVANNDEELARFFVTTQSEAKNYFGNPAIFLERYVSSPHHIEVQIIADTQGHICHLFERECSMQRRHQKVIEEAPAPFLQGHDDVRDRLLKIAVEGAKRIGYTNAGTMEFVMGGDHSFYFLEMNTRIQVEHPVTELITGIDIVKEQLRIAAGLPLSFTQAEVVARGAAMECRLYAENPHTFLPSPGSIAELWLPGGPFVRVDSALLAGKPIPIEYDPMIAKISAWGRDRAECLARMSRALAETVVAGSLTNLEFLRHAFSHKVFRSGIYTTKFIEEFHDELANPKNLPPEIIKHKEEILAVLSAQESGLLPPAQKDRRQPTWWRQDE